MALECIRFSSRGRLAVIGALAAGALYVWAVDAKTDTGRAESAAQAVLISVSMLDMSSLEPAHFGDWEAPPQAK